MIYSFFYTLLLMLFAVEKDVCVCGPLIKVWRVKLWRKECGTDVSIFFFIWCYLAGGEEGTTFCCQTALTPGYGAWSFDVILEIDVEKNVSRGLLEWF